MSPVPYNLENFRKCRCDACPVYRYSQCITQEQINMPPTAPSPSPVLPEPGSVQGLYCAAAVGASSCGDLDERWACVCPTCAVWQEYDLETAYYCTRGSAS